MQTKLRGGRGEVVRHMLYPWLCGIFAHCISEPESNCLLASVIGFSLVGISTMGSVYFLGYAYEI